MVRALGGRGDDVRLLAHDNSSLGPAQPWTAEIADLPYVVPLGNKHGRFSTVALDFDAKLGEPGDAATHADIVCSLLDEAGFPYVLARSGPFEGRHVFFIVRGPGGVEVRTTRLLVRRLIALGLTTLDPSCMSSVQSCIRPPGAPHRAGGVSTPLVSWETAVDRLRSDRPDAPRRSDVVEFVDALAGAGDMRLELQPTSTAIAGAPGSSAGEEYASGSQHLQAVATRVVSLGQTENDLTDEIASLDATHPILIHLAKKSASQREAAIHRSFKKAVQWVAENPAAHQGGQDDLEVIGAWEAFDLTMLPKPMAAVVVVMHKAAKRNRSKLVGMSNRVAGDLASVSAPTAQRGLKAAVEAGLLFMVDGGAGVKAARYRLNHPDLWSAAVRDAVGPSPVRGGVRLPTASRTAASEAEALGMNVGAELWFEEALGHARRQVYVTLSRLGATGEAVTTKAVAGAVGKSERQVRDDLRRLADAGLARYLGKGQGWVAEARDVSAVTDQLGVTGIADGQRRRHQRQRQANALKVVGHRLRRKFAEVPEGGENGGDRIVVEDQDRPLRERHRDHCPVDHGSRRPARSSAATCRSRRACSSAVGSRHTISTRSVSRPRPRRPVPLMRTASTCPSSSCRRPSTSSVLAHSSPSTLIDTR